MWRLLRSLALATVCFHLLASSAQGGALNRGTRTEPAFKRFGIHAISLTPALQINPAWSTLVSCCAATGLIFCHRARYRKGRLQRER